MDLSPVGLVAVGVAGTTLLLFVVWRPRAALASCVMLVLLASTKFRSRDAYALLRGDMDSQIFFEIGLYAVLFTIAIRGLLLLPVSAFRLGRSGALLGGYVGVALLSTLWSANLDLTFVRALQLFVLFTYAFVAVTVLGPRRLLWITMASVVLYVVVFSGLAHLLPSADGTRISNGVPRFTWFAVHPIGAGVFAGTAALFLLACALFPRGDGTRGAKGILEWCLVAYSVWVMLDTQSRGPIFAFALAACLLLVRKYVVGTRALLTSDRVLLGLLATAITLLVPIVTGRRGTRILFFVLRGQTSEEFLSMTGRTGLWKIAIGSSMEHPLLGQGYVSARQVLLQQVEWGGHTHNALIESLFSVGLLGAALLWIPFLVVLGASFLRTVRLHPDTVRYHAIVCSGMVFLLFNSVTGDSFASIASYEPMLLFVLVLSHDAMAGERMVAANPTPARLDLHRGGPPCVAPAPS